MSRPAVVEELIKLGTVTLGNSYHSPLKSGFSNSKSDLATRVSFKVIPSAFPLLSFTYLTIFTSIGIKIAYSIWSSVFELISSTR